MCDTEPNMCDTEQQLVIVRHIWQKLSSVEHKKTRIVKITGSLFTHIWRNQIVQIPTALTGKDRFCGGRIF